MTRLSMTLIAVAVALGGLWGGGLLQRVSQAVWNWEPFNVYRMVLIQGIGFIGWVASGIGVAAGAVLGAISAVFVCVLLPLCLVVFVGMRIHEKFFKEPTK